MENDTKAQVRALGLALALAMAAVGANEFYEIPLFDEGREAEVTAAFVAEACVAQFGVGERWSRHTHVYQCAPAAREVPSNILSFPVTK